MSNVNMGPAQNTLDLPPGALVGTYQIERKVGGGSMAVVYRALDVQTGRVWAVKEMRPQAEAGINMDEARTQFEQEAKLLSGLHHANLPEVVAHFEQAGRAYLVMEFVDGQTLEKHAAALGGIVPESTVIPWAIQLCDVLEYLHTQNPPIIFRDLKPSNIMVTHAGVIKLIDFGIARTYKVGKKRDTVAMGSQNYAPIEQFGNGQTTARSDVYALGATLYHLLTGTPPRFAFLPDPLTPPRTLNPFISAELDRTVLKAMEKLDTQRYRAAKDFGDALRRLQPNAPVPLPVVAPVPPPQPAPGTPCPACGHINRPQARFCGACRMLLRGQLTASLQLPGGGAIQPETPVRKTPFRIGRPDPAQPPPDLDLTAYDAMYVSRSHAVITRSGNDYAVTDLGSANGTFVNGQQLAPQQPRLLQNGDRIDVGAVKLVFKVSITP